MKILCFISVLWMLNSLRLYINYNQIVKQRGGTLEITWSIFIPIILFIVSVISLWK